MENVKFLSGSRGPDLPAGENSSLSSVLLHALLEIMSFDNPKPVIIPSFRKTSALFRVFAKHCFSYRAYHKSLKIY